MFNRIKITTKLYGGFATVLALLAVMSILAVTGFWSVQSLFGDYRQTARTSLILGELEEKLIVARISALKYRATGDASTADEVRLNVKAITDELQALPELITDQTKITAIQEKSGKMVDYLSAFEETVRLRADRNAQVAHLSELGPAARKKMSDVMESAYRDDDAQAAFYAGRVNEALMLGRFYTERYLLNNTTEARDRALKELQEATTRSEKLLNSLQNPTRRSLAAESIKLTTEYVNTVNAISDVIAERNGYRRTMDEIGPEVMNSYKTLLAEQVNHQNELGPTAEAQIGATTTQVMILAIVCLILGSVAAIFLGRMISTGIARVNADMGELVNGNKNFEVFGTDRGDEIGDMARALDVFRLNALEVERLEAERKAEEENGVQAERKAAMLKMADDFENRVGTIVDEVSRVAGALSTSAEMLSETAGQSRERSGSVAAASEEASANVQTVASAAEQLTAAIGEVSETIGRAAEMARRSADMAGESQGELDRLNGAIADVDTVIGSINDVAEQTNLLALNATIEAARAGEMGKGFAVVAQEVKALANQTKTMTDEIASKLNAVRESAQAAIKATVAIISEVREIDTTTASIAATMEEQSSATLEISRSTQDAAEGAIEVSRSIQGVSEAVDRSEVETQSVRQASGELTTTASELKVQVDGFVTEIRAA